jgi:hypothetical protein
VAAVMIALLFVGWPRMLAAGARLRAQHRWAAAACTVAGAPRVCAFRATLPAPGQGVSPLRGVWDGFGLRYAPPGVAAATDLDLPAGKYSVSMRVEAPASSPDGAEVALIIAGTEAKRTSWPAIGSPIALVAPVTHAGGKLHIEIRTDGRFVVPEGDSPALWVSAFEVDVVNSPSGS